MDIHTERDLGLVIRQRRRDLGLDQEALAARAGVSRQWVVEVEKGKPRAEVGLVLRLLRVLGLELRAGDPESAPAAGTPLLGLIDVDAIVDRARGPATRP